MRIFILSITLATLSACGTTTDNFTGGIVSNNPPLFLSVTSSAFSVAPASGSY